MVRRKKPYRHSNGNKHETMWALIGLGVAAAVLFFADQLSRNQSNKYR